MAAVAVLTDEIAALVERLRLAFDPEEIVLFGSRAYGTPRPESDTDLLLVLRPTDEPLHDRLVRAARVTSEVRHVAADVHPYTVDELHAKLARGDPAVRDALARGELLYPASVQARSAYHHLAGEWCRMAASDLWLQRSRDDLDAAEAMLAVAGQRRRQWWAVAFHAQQAAEKALKALIYHLGGEPERTHELSDLMHQVVALDRAVGQPLLIRHQARVAELRPYAVETRYPDGPAVDEEQARRAVDAACDLVVSVSAILPPAAEPARPPDGGSGGRADPPK